MSSLTLALIQTPLNPSRLLVLPDYSRLCHMTSRSRALPPLQTNNYLSIYVWLTLTLARVCPHSHLITLYSLSEVVIEEPCYMQVHPPRIYISMVILILNYISPPFLQHILWQCCNSPGILSSMAEILLFNLVFHDRITPVSVLTLKSPLRVIEVLPLKPQASLILSVCI